MKSIGRCTSGSVTREPRRSRGCRAKHAGLISRWARLLANIFGVSFIDWLGLLSHHPILKAPNGLDSGCGFLVKMTFST